MSDENDSLWEYVGPTLCPNSKQASDYHIASCNIIKFSFLTDSVKYEFLLRYVNRPHTISCALEIKQEIWPLKGWVSARCLSTFVFFKQETDNLYCDIY